MNYVVDIITLGTPFSDSSAARVAILRTRFARCLGSSSSDKLIKVVKKHNPGVDDLEQHFCQAIQINPGTVLLRDPRDEPSGEHLS
jgi:hypothetical protein